MKQKQIVVGLIIVFIVYLFFPKEEGFFPANIDFTEQENDYFSLTRFGNNSGEWYDWNNIRAEVQELVNSKNFSQLEKFVDQARTEKLQHKNVSWVLMVLYNIISQTFDNYESFQEFASEWRQNSPESNIPYIIEARAYRAKAWEVRGGSYSHKVTNEQNYSYRDYLSKSWDSISLAANKGPVDAEVCSVQVSLFFILHKDKKSAKDLFYKCVQIEPGYIDLYEITTNYLQSKWYGSNKELLQFVEDSADATQNFYGDGMYALLVASLRDDNSKYFRIFEQQGGDFSWPRTKAGFEDIIERFGKSHHILHIYAYCAMMVNDYEVLAELLKEIGTKWDNDKEFYFIKKSWYDFNLSRARAYM
jgi:hypothetical protein